MPTLVQITLLLLLSGSALAQRSIDFAPFEIPADGNIVVPVAQGESLTGLAAELDAQTDGALSLATTEAKFTGENNQTLTLFGIKPYSRIDLIGIGDKAASRLTAEAFGGLAASLNDGTSGTHVGILWSGIDGDEAGVLRHDPVAHPQADDGKSYLGHVWSFVRMRRRSSSRRRARARIR